MMIVNEGDHRLDTAVEPRHRKIGACLAQDLLGLLKLAVLPLQRLQLLGRNAGLCPLSTSAFLTQSCRVSGVQPILAAIEVPPPARRMLAGVIQNHPNHTGRDLG